MVGFMFCKRFFVLNVMLPFLTVACSEAIASREDSNLEDHVVVQQHNSNVIPKQSDENPVSEDDAISKPFQFPPGCVIPEKARIIHIPQMHSVLNNEYGKDGYSYFLKENIARTQFLIARFILNNKDGLYIDESLNTPLDSNNISEFVDSTTDRMLTFNPHESYENLTQITKDFLIEFGGGFLLFYKRYLDVLYPSISPKDSDRIYSKIFSKQEELDNLIEAGQQNNQDGEYILEQLSELAKVYQEMGYHIMDEREVLLKDEVMKLMSNSEEKIFFIYGAAHDFSDEFEGESFHKVPDVCVIPEDFLIHSRFLALLNDAYVMKIINENKDLSYDEVISYEKWREIDSKYQEGIEIIRNHIQGKNSVGIFNIKKDDYYTMDEIEGILGIVDQQFKNVALLYGD